MRRILLLLFATALLAASEARILVIRPDLPTFAATAEALVHEVGPTHPITTWILPAEREGIPVVPPPDLREPAVVVALDNRAVAVARQQFGPLGPPILAGMALNLADHGEAQVAGVAFEVAPFTLVTRFQAATQSRIRAVLLPYRGAAFQGQVDQAVRQLERAGIRVVPRDLAAQGDDPQRIAWILERHLQEWAAAEGIDAVLVPSDNGLVNRRTLPIWARVARRSSTPFLTGVDRLVSERLGFCLYAASPDPVGVGQQLAQQVLHLLEDGHRVGDLGIEPPVQVDVRADLVQAQRLGITFVEPVQRAP